jgi:PAS domain S-box-containing protein
MAVHEAGEILERTSDAFVALDREWRYTHVNRRAVELLGKSAAELVGRCIWDLFPFAVGTELHRECHRAMAEQVPIQLVTLEPTLGRWYECRLDPSPERLAITWDDVSERRRESEAIRTTSVDAEWSAALLRILADSIPDPVFVKDAECRLLYANPATAKAIGKPAEQLLGKTDREFYDDPEVSAAILETDRRIMESGEAVAVEERIQTPEGYQVFLSTKAPFRDAAGKVLGLVGVARDITERRRAEEALRESETRYRLLFQNMLDGLAYCRMIYDARGRPEDFVYLEVNRAFGELTGLRDVVGKKASEVFPGIREAHPELLEAYGRVARSGKSERVELHFEPLARWLTISVYQPQPDHFVAVFDDITQRKRAEESLREDDRRKTDFLAVLSHELRNPLAPIRNSTYLLERAASDSDQARRAREVIRRQTEHLTRLVDDLLDVTRISRGKIDLERGRVDLRDIVRKSMDDARSLFERSEIELRLEHAAGPVWVDADPTRIAQVIGNILHNAQKFTPAGGLVTVRLAAADGRVRLHVKDTGIGMESGHEERMFEPFAQGQQGIARTKGGLGLGLSLVKSLVEMHGGSVTARSEGTGRGTELVVSLPLAGAEPREQPAGAVTDGPPREILVIEDNDDAAETLADLLSLGGHRVRVARTGRSGLALARASKPDVILCDVGLPDIDGYELARAVRADPALKETRLVALTGYAQPEDRERARGAGFDAHVAKPPDPAALARMLRGDGT